VQGEEVHVDTAAPLTVMTILEREPAVLATALIVKFPLLYELLEGVTEIIGPCESNDIRLEV
jgi:hypothetical protein